MSLVVTEKASFANDDDLQTTKSKDDKLDDSVASLCVTQDAKGAQPVEGNDKDNDNEKCAVDTQQRGLPIAELNQPQPSNGAISNKSQGKSQEHKGEAADKETAQNDTISSSASARRPSTTSRFKEKRPEPLKLNPNQEIPLDLSVKSAGNVPSGNIFNLALINNLMGPLETPRIQWQDNDALLTSAKGRLFSSSTNASQRARLSSLIGDSPPITPGTPLVDMMFSPQGAPSTMRPSGGETTHSALHAAESPLHSFLTSPFDLNKLRTPLINHHHNGSNNNHNLRAGDLKGTPRRSCSTDNLSVRNNTISSLSVNQDGPGTNTKKHNSVSPLATKSISSKFGATTNNSNAATKFLYSNQQINATSKIDAQRSPTASSSPNNGKSLTPTSVANATANLLNIHLNSPNGNSSQSPVNPTFDGSLQQQQQHQQNPYKVCQFPEPSPLDPLLSAVSYCQQQQQLQQQQQQPQQRSPFANIPSTSNSSDHFHHQSGLNSLSSSATLNTPTLISPSQLKAGHMCFLPSPTLSPMSSVFELPSPFLMFPPPSSSTHLSQQQTQQSNHHQRGGSTSTTTNTEANNNKSPRGSESSRSDASATIASHAKSANVNLKQSGTLSAASQQSRSSSEIELIEKRRTGPSANDLQQLITTAAQKSRLNSTDNEDSNGDVKMNIDDEDDTNHEARDDSCSNERPATVIPQICVSNHHKGGDEVKQVDGATTNRGCDWARANEQHLDDERHESSSAPPEVYRPRAKSKLKTIGADSCFNLTGSKSVAMARVDNSLGGTGSCSQDKPTSRSHSNINQTLHDRPTMCKPYPVVRRLIAASSQQIQATGNNAYQNGQSTFPEATRSNSAEPAVYQRNSNALKVSQQNSTSNGESSGQLYLRQNISSSAQHLTNPIKADSQLFASNSADYQPQQSSQFSSNQQSQYLSQGLVYDQHQYYHRPQADIQQRNEFGYGHEQQQQQQTSISANDLHRLQNNRHPVGGYPPVVSSHMIVAAAAVNNNNNNSVKAIPVQNNRPSQPQQHFFQQNLQSIPLSPSNRFDTLQSSYNGYQQHFAQQQQQQQQQQNMSGNTTASSVSLLRLAERQTSSQLLSNEALLRRTTMNNSMATTRGDPMASFASDNSRLHCVGYPLESESRSESRSSCSLDFTNSFSGSGRLDHSGGSNLVAKKYHCDHCSKSFTRSDMLTRHRRLHSGDRPFQCNECRQEFSRSDHLSTHMRTHTGEKPYKCKLCSYSACRKDMITRHLKVHNRNPHSAEPI